MLEFYKVGTNSKVLINPKCVVYIEVDGQLYTRISLSNGTSFIVNEPFYSVKNQILKYLPPL